MPLHPVLLSIGGPSGMPMMRMGMVWVMTMVAMVPLQSAVIPFVAMVALGVLVTMVRAVARASMP